MDAWLSQYPTREIDEPATKDLVRAEAALLHTDLAEVRTELKTEIGELRTELKTEIGELRTELKTEIGELRTELKTEIGELRTETRAGFADVDVRFVELRGEMEKRFAGVDVRFAELRQDLGGQISEMSEKLQSIIRTQLYWLLGTGLTMTLTILAMLAGTGKL